ncbi:ParB/RepB/Spo0J family partition protein [Sphingomonas leidyi]|jgi:ParB family chromosome partitioning protein|uniref:ParB/RepB/Spo0J family partition protein n=1 Tax=Sphingomonas leidyi TaxID=68569 RepID=UPI0036D261B4
MRLEFIPLDKLAVGKANMRHGRKNPDVSDILPTVRKRGVLQTLLVRPNLCPEPVEGSAPDMFEIVAGRRRYHAARIVAEERAAADTASGADPDPQIDMLPCAILDEGDDADAIEASMIENMARLDADEVTRWETFTRLVREGRSVEEIGLTFGLPELLIRRALALGNLLPRIRALYAAEKIDAVTVRHLTLASKAQQKDWLALVDSENARAPTGHQLKAWLFGGQSIAVKYALFDVEASGLAVIADLFGEDRYFADSDAFWTAQNAAIEERRAAFIADGWSDAVIVPLGEHFSSWEHEKAGKRKGGRVYIDVRPTGEVVIHEGYVSRKEAARAARGGEGEAASAMPARPEVTSGMQTYIDLHRHAAVRAALTGHPSVALRLMVAHAIGGSHLWRVQPEPQSSQNDAVRESVETCIGETCFDECRRAVLALLGFSSDEPTVTGGNGDGFGLVGIFRRLLELDDAAVMEVIAIVMGETLASGSAAVEAVGLQIGVDMASYWRADDAFLDLIRDKEVLVGMIGEVAGAEVAKANASEKTKAMKAIIADSLAGTDGRTKVENWVPRWLAFPPSAYTERGGVGSVRAHAKAVAALAPTEPEEGADVRVVAAASADPQSDAPAPAPEANGEAQPLASEAEEDAPPLAA